MKIIELMCEDTLYRGHSANDDYKGNQPIVWFSYDPKVAAGYSVHRDDSTITKIEYTPRHSVDVGRSEHVTTIGSLLSTIVKNVNVSPAQIASVKPLFLQLRAHFGQSSLTLDKFWLDNDKFAEFLDQLGIDSIIATEDNYKTIGILRKHLQ